VVFSLEETRQRRVAVVKPQAHHMSVGVATDDFTGVIQEMF
jgi:hypothetical protein